MADHMTGTRGQPVPRVEQPPDALDGPNGNPHEQGEQTQVEHPPAHEPAKTHTDKVEDGGTDA